LARVLYDFKEAVPSLRKWKAAALDLIFADRRAARLRFVLVGERNRHGLLLFRLDRDGLFFVPKASCQAVSVQVPGGTLRNANWPPFPVT